MIKRSLAYEMLSPQGKAAYDHLAAALDLGKSHIDINPLNGYDPMIAFRALTSDNPHLIWFNRTYIQTYSSMIRGMGMCLTNVHDEPSRRFVEGELEEAVQEALAYVARQKPLTDFDRLLSVYTYLQKHITYNHGEKRYIQIWRRAENYWSHSAYGALVEGTAVCDGFASAFTLLASRLGYEVTEIHGTGHQNGQPEDHSWNLLRLGGQCYHLDLTWDANQFAALKVPNYDYFCLDDATIALDHQWDLNRTLTCNGTALSYHRHCCCYANNLSQVQEIFRRFAHSTDKIIRLRLAEGIALDKEEETMSRLLSQAFQTAGRPYSMHYLWNPTARSFTAVLD